MMSDKINSRPSVFYDVLMVGWEYIIDRNSFCQTSFIKPIKIAGVGRECIALLILSKSNIMAKLNDNMV